MPASGTVSQPWPLMVEFVILFVGLPLAFRFKLVPIPPIPALWLLTGYCLYQLLNDAGFDRKLLWSSYRWAASAPQILALFAVAATIVGAAIYLVAPQLLFNFVRRAPAFWALVMLLYPALSVYPQGIVYRVFIFERYCGLFPNSALLILISAFAFSFAHIIFRNPIAVTLTLLGGFLFAWRYAETDSLFTSSFEHALYGCWMFTVGLGEYFYKGARIH